MTPVLLESLDLQDVLDHLDPLVVLVRRENLETPVYLDRLVAMAHAEAAV